MVSAVGSGLVQQVPGSNVFQPGGGAESVKRTEETASTPERTSASSRRSDSAESSRSYEATAASTDRAEDNGRTHARAERGTEVDITA